jgi:hypothetical protein
MSPEKLPTVFMYMPEQWDYVDRFAKWHGPPFPANPMLSNGLQAISGHRNKLETVARRATQLFPELIEERSQFDKQGYSNMAKAHEFTALLETLVCELYACLDGLCSTIYVIYERIQGVQRKSTERLFKCAAEGKYGNGFPPEICTLLKLAYKDWFLNLRRVRTELTHGRVGTCSVKKDGKISYMHVGLGTGTRAFIIDDIIEWINTYIEHVDSLLNAICKFWLDQLEPREVMEMCGIHRGRFMGRAIIVTEPVTQDSGLCIFRHMYEEEPELACPLRFTCVAYERVGNKSREICERLTSSSVETA